MNEPGSLPPDLPQTSHCTVLAGAGSATARVEWRRFDWRGLHEATFAASMGYLELTRVRSSARYLHTRGEALIPQGAIRYVPADRPFYCQWIDERQEALQCALDIPRLTGEPFHLPGHRLAETFDLRHDRLRFLLGSMRAELTSPGLSSGALLDALCTAAAVELLREFSRPRSPSRDRGERLDARHLDEIVMRLREEGLRPRLDALAREQGMSSRHYARLFQQVTGQGFASFVSAQTVRFAQDLLNDRRQPIKAIALSCGFADTAAFSKGFRRATGLTPGAFRAGSQ